MFKVESELQELVHQTPELILNGIPDIAPDCCSDAPPCVSLGREIPLDSGRLDNLFVDANAILTIIECKRYGDTRLKRGAYSQAINYASDFQKMLRHVNGPEFIGHFFQIISQCRDGTYGTLDQVLDAMSKAPLLQDKDTRKWREQFAERLEFNVQRGVFRIIILCGASPDVVFSADWVRNLMQVMSFSEKETAKYDLLLMDIRESGDRIYTPRIVWRRYAPLPEIPLIASISRDTSRGVEAMRERRKVMGAKVEGAEQALTALLKMLDKSGYFVQENTEGLAIFKDNKRSIFTVIKITESGWTIVRHQIRKGESLYSSIESKNLPAFLSRERVELVEKTSSATDRLGDAMYDMKISSCYDKLPDPELFKELQPQ